MSEDVTINIRDIQHYMYCGDNASVVNGACACNQGYEGDPIKGCTAKPAPTPDPTPSTDPSPDTSPSPDPTPSEDTQDQNDENKD